MVILIDCIEYEYGRIIKYNNNVIIGRTTFNNSFITEFCSESNGFIDSPAYKKSSIVVNNIVVRENYKVRSKLFPWFLISHQVFCGF
jgi:hypothetical protein